MSVPSLPLNTPTDNHAEGGTTKGCEPPILFAWWCWDIGYHPYLSCWLHLHRELGGGKESRGWMQSLGVHGAQGGLQRTKLPEAHWGSP